MVNTTRQSENLRKKFQNEDESARKHAIELLLGDSNGRRFIWLLLGELGTFSTPFDRDPIEMARRVGEQNVGLRLLSELTSNFPDLYATLMKENARVERDRYNRAENIRNTDIAQHGDIGTDEYIPDELRTSEDY